MVKVGLDYTLLIQIVQFLIIVFIANKLIINPVRGAYNKRNDKISKLDADAQNCLEDIAQRKREYEARLGVVRSEIADYQNKLKKDAETRAQDMLSKVQSEVNAEMEVALKSIAAEAEAAKQAIRKDVPELSAQIVQMVSK